MPAQFPSDPQDYLERIHGAVPRYEELQEQAIAAIPFAPERILELGFGTAETTRRIWKRFPESRITGLDSSPEMVFRARELGWEEMRLARIEDPLPDGPWDLVIAVLVVHDLGDEAKRDLFRRVRETARALVVGDVVEPGEATRWAGWCEGEVVWEADDLAVVRALYPSSSAATDRRRLREESDGKGPLREA